MSYQQIKSGIKWNGSSSIRVERLGFGKSLNNDIGHMLVSRFAKYTPEKTGNMIKLIRVSSNNDTVSLVYLTKYAKYQYCGSAYHHTKMLATAFWDKTCWQVEKSSITREINLMRRRYAK